MTVLYRGNFQVTGLLHGVEYNVEIACAIIYAVCIFYSCVGGIKDTGSAFSLCFKRGFSVRSYHRLIRAGDHTRQ